MNHVTRFKTSCHLGLIFLISLLLLGCGSGGGDRAGVDSLKTYTASGTVSGALQQGVSLKLSGKDVVVATTDVNGNYSLSGLANGSYTVIPVKSGYIFSPSSIAVSVNNGNVTIPNFTATVSLAQTYTLSGTVSGDVMKDVLLTLSGAGNATTTTNSTGNFSFNNLTNGSYTVIASLPGYGFTPATVQVTINGAIATLSNIVSSKVIAPTYNITGAVSGDTQAGVTINLSGAATKSAVTDAGGNFSFGNLDNGVYTLTPVKNGFTFDPAKAVVTLASANSNGPYFKATLKNPGKLVGGTIQGNPLNLAALVTPFAGSGTAGNSDGVGIAALFNAPAGMTSDGSNLYVVDRYNHSIRKVVIATGAVTTFAGTGAEGAVDGVGTAASFSFPYGITTDGANLYVTDNLNYKIRKIVIATGVVTSMTGVANTKSALGVVDGNSAQASFYGITGITTDGTNLFVAEQGNNKIRRINIATGNVSSLTGAGSTKSAAGATDGPGNTALFNSPTGLTTDGLNLYVADLNNNKIRKIVIATGVVSSVTGATNTATATGSTDGAAVLASFNRPTGVVTDGFNVYVADGGNRLIRKIVLASGDVSTLGGSAPFTVPEAIVSDGNALFISDSYKNIVYKLE